MKPLKQFYEECIRTKILQCDLRASRVKGRSHCARHLAEINRAKAAFFEDNKEQLVDKMLQNGVGMDLAKINARLIEAFLEAFPARAFSIEGERQYRDLVYEETGQPQNEIGNNRINGQERLCTCYSFEASKIQHLYDLPWADTALIGDAD